MVTYHLQHFSAFNITRYYIDPTSQNIDHFWRIVYVQSFECYLVSKLLSFDLDFTIAHRLLRENKQS